VLTRLVRPIELPTLLLWGGRDKFLVRELTEGLEQWVPRVRVEHLPEATHWVQNDEPERVNAAVLAFLASEPAPVPSPGTPGEG
jgi:pimeloyl-ACP methyl ester carboxylesterase